MLDLPLPPTPSRSPDAVALSARLALRERPTGAPLLRQQWSELLFLHWPVPAELLQAHLPPRLRPDTHEGQAWIAIVPFEMSKVRTRYTPVYYGYARPSAERAGSYDENWGFELMWQPMEEITTGRARACTSHSPNRA